jgi:hypothetical protein
MTWFHYTAATGLKGIIESKSIWATDHRFLNDPSEFTHGWAMVFSALKSRKAELDKLSDEIWITLESFREHGERHGVFAFVGSLTSEGDLLSQWRGYGGGKGFAIGFNEDWLLQNAMAQGFDIHPVVYSPEEQRRAADDAVTLLVGLLTEREPAKHFEIMREWWKHALKVSLILKDPNFAEERERRLVWIGSSWPPELNTRVAGSRIIPYRSCSFAKVAVNISLHPRNCGIEEIIVGPAHNDQQLASIDALLSTQLMRTTIRRSAIPFIAD